MAQILSGKEVAAALTLQLKEETQKLKTSGVTPCLAIVRVGERGDDLAYERGAVKRCQSVGIDVRHFVLPADASQDDLMKTVEQVNADRTIHGCLIFMPLPAQMDEAAVRAALLPEKDADGITPGSQVGVYTGRDIGYPPCTPAACMEILKYYKVALKGASAVVLGRSLVVGRPLAMMLLRENATVTLCHSKTRDIASVARKADILAAAMGRAGAVSAEFTNPDQVIIDVGINVTAEGKLAGDVTAEAAQAAKACTPVPGGVGAVTTTVLGKHVIEAAKLSAKR